MNIKILYCIFWAMVTHIAMAQEAPQKQYKFSKTDKDSVLLQLIKELPARYIFPDTAEKVVAYLRKQHTAGGYKDINDASGFAAALTSDLKRIGNDRHLRVRYSPTPIPVSPDRDIMTVAEDDKPAYHHFLKTNNYGIRALEVLDGNIGYIDFNFFCDPEFAGDTYAAAMTYLSHTDALIIDLRKCRGSMSPNAIPFLASYFFEHPTHLNDLYWRKDNRLTQSWTYAHVSGKRYLKKPVYLLTSFTTFSGAEELAYDLQTLKRAVIIGQPTGGGANPGGIIRLTNHFNVFIPIGRAINPVTGTNWEGIGVTPDSLLNPVLALTKAKECALTYLIAQTNDNDWKNSLIDLQKKIQASKKELTSNTFELKGFEHAKEVFVSGSFNDWAPRATRMILKDGKWSGTADAGKGKIWYHFIVDGKIILDPVNKITEKVGERESSVKIVE